ncbi:MAG: peptidoglycan-associated lipoprotein Pal [Gammaproteobacteria bacterium]|nr:peptidoglycan-associated lipoprotein Pal [Gammaproteobacteria bacterium]
MKLVAKLGLAILPVLLIVGCGSKDVKEDVAPVGENVVVEDGGATTGEGTGGTLLDDSQAAANAAADADKDLLAERKVYFDFDRSEILGDYKEILNAHARHLIATPSASIMIEGNCDERGTREYNMALGERRAFSVLQFLTLQGVSKSQISTVSFGEERPDVEGHDEAAWKWNRRAVLVYSE